MRLFALAALLTLATPAFAQDIARDYRVEGRNADGTAYAGTLTIAAAGELYSGTWQIAGDTWRGSGPLEGRVLTLDFSSGDHPIIYVVMPDGDLHGTWEDGRAIERAEPLN